MKSVAVFCGSHQGDNPIYRQQAYQLGAALGQKKIKLVYGGSSVGLMGILADSVIEQGAETIGVMPKFIDALELTHNHLSQLIEVDDFANRKKVMMDISDGFIVLPGGLGTLDELFEVWTQSIVGQCPKPIAILNTNHFYDALLLHLEQIVQQGFLERQLLDALIVSDNIGYLLTQMENQSFFPNKLKAVSQ